MRRTKSKRVSERAACSTRVIVSGRKSASYSPCRFRHRDEDEDAVKRSVRRG